MKDRKEAKAKLHGTLSTILREHAGTRVNGKVASERTMTSYGQVLRMCFNTLHELGHHLQNPRNLNDNHIRELCRHWHKNDKKVSTMQEYLSKLRVFSEEWIKRPEPVRSLSHYLPDVDPKLLVVRKAALASKSWTENDIDVAEKIELADEFDPRFGLMLRLQLFFGLRRKEVLMTRPWKADRVNKLVVYPGEAKGGRPRDIFIEWDGQREVLDFVKSRIGPGEHLGWRTTYGGKAASFKYNVGRYNRCMAKIGITKDESLATGHGLRAQYAENSALISGVVPPSLGGLANQMESATLNLRLEKISELLGHSRPEITQAYLSTFGRGAALVDKIENLRRVLQAALVHCHVGVTTVVPIDRQADCFELLLYMEPLEIDISLRQAHFLWAKYSERYARDWVKPEKGILEALEAAAIHITKRNLQ